MKDTNEAKDVKMPAQPLGKNALRCWFASSKEETEFNYIEVVFARSHQEAKTTAWKRGWDIVDECDNNYLNLKISRKKEFDHLASGVAPYICRDKKTLREMWIMLEGDAVCDSCGKAEFEGEFPVCEECGQCVVCGHMDDCQTNSKQQ